jgi:phosphatidylglycerol lysyltransferase
LVELSEIQNDEPTLKERVLPVLGGLFSVGLFAGALAVIHHELKAYHYHDVLQHLSGLPVKSILLALALTLLNYLALTGYDALALRTIGRPLSYARVAFVSFISYVFSYNVGLSLFGGAAIRYRLYSAWGLSFEEIAKVVSLCVVTLWVGFFTLAGIMFLTFPIPLPATVHLLPGSVKFLGIFFLTLVAVYLVLGARLKKPIPLWRWEMSLPSPATTLQQMLLSSLDWILAGTVLYVLLPGGLSLSFGPFLGIFLLAQLAGLVSHVPGGLGVFETVMLLFLSPMVPTPLLIGTLIVYRMVYYLTPLAVAAILMAGYEIRRKKDHLKTAVNFLDRRISGILPLVSSVTTFAAGTILLFSGATPALQGRLVWLKAIVPLPVLEVSHFLGSVIGTLLLFLAWGLYRRLDAAYILTKALLGAGIVFSLLKGLDYEEAAILAAMLVVLIPCRRHFYRKTSLLEDHFTLGWTVSIAAVILSSIGLGLFSFKHLAYSEDLWWRFELAGDGPRFLRALVGAGGAVLVVAVLKLLRPPRPEAAAPQADEWARIHSIVKASPETDANLAFLKDKTFLFNDDGNAFIMYRAIGRSWIAMGDPLGPSTGRAELVWRFRELCDEHNSWPVFYQIRKRYLDLYLDLGLHLFKLGEEGRVSLPAFSLEGSARKNLRYTFNKREKEGYVFEIVPAAGVPALVPELKVISDQWLADKKSREKGFSLGCFDEDYLKEFSIALVKKEGKTVAFANLWLGADKEELSVDLMRHLPEANGLMEYLFIALMLWGRDQGYRSFNLGMAPLSGIQDRSLAPLWNRVGAFLFRHGEHFYNFQGLRDYKEKFDPEWQPKYLACPGGLVLPRILVNLSTAISGGLKGVVAK